MADKGEFFDNLKEAGELVLSSEPFTDWLGFFSSVDAAYEKNGPSHGEIQSQAQYDTMENWAKKMAPEFKDLGGDLTWDISVSSYFFEGTASYGEPGMIMADFPIPVNIDNLPAHELHKTCNVHVSVSSDDYESRMSFRQQYGEPFLDDVVVTRSFHDVSDQFIQEMMQLPINIISKVEPLEEMARREIDGRKEKYPGEFPFYFENVGIDFSDFKFKDGKVIVPKDKIIKSYLAKSPYEPFNSERAPNLLHPFRHFIKPIDEEELDKQVRDIFRKASDRRNQRIAELISVKFNPLNGTFYAMCYEQQAEYRTPRSCHVNSKNISSLNPNAMFPRRYVIKFGIPNEKGERDLSVSFSRESFGNYCIWMREDQSMKKVVDHVSGLGLR